MLSGSWVSLAAESGDECLDSRPVFEGQIEHLTQEWKLPISPQKPEIITEARMGISLVPPGTPGGRWRAALSMMFPDPKPFGIPYTVQKIELRWSGTLPGTAAFDWTFACSGPGRSCFPGQKWEQDWEVPGTEGVIDSDWSEVRLWGSRN